jgi:hypothetical protein
MKLNKIQLIFLIVFLVTIVLIIIIGGLIYLRPYAQEDTIKCEEYTFENCPEGCKRYIGPSFCSFDIGLMMEICTEDIVEACISKNDSYPDKDYLLNREL